MRSRVELYEQIRRDRDREGTSKRGLARRHGVHRRTVRQALASAVPPPRKHPEGRPVPKLGPYRALIDRWLLHDRDAPPKQRHTAKRIWERLVAEHGAGVAERTVREYVAARRRVLFAAPGACVPQAHPPGAEAECDWGSAKAQIAGDERDVNLFVIRLSHSGAAWVEAFPAATQQAFLEAHAHAFAFFDGVPGRVRYDNLKAAVTKILRGRRRVESDRFVALRSHYLYESFFCQPGKEGAHEKGGVEGEVGRFRRAHLVPVPQVGSLSELNALLRAACERDLGRRITGRERTVGEALAGERSALRPLPAEPFDATETSSVRVDSKGMVTVRHNRYSVPISLTGMRVAARIGAREIEIVRDGASVACHERCHGRYETTARLDHYLELLRRKPGALAGSEALAQERERGAWPASFDELWRTIEERQGVSEAARQMVDLLLLCRDLGPERVELAVRGATVAGIADGRAVAVLARQRQRAEVEPIELGERLRAIGTPEPDISGYDELLGGQR